MAGTFKDIGTGAIGGAATGAAFGLPGMIAGGIGGGIIGAFTQNPPTADELGIKPLDAREMAKEFLPSEFEMQTQRNDFATRNDQSSERTAENMIAAGMDPARAYAIANRNNAPNAVRNERNQNAQRMSLMDSLARQFKPYEINRNEDILNYNLATQNQPGILESFIPLAVDLYASQGVGGVKDAWSGTGKNLSKPGLNIPNGADETLSGYLGQSPNQNMPAQYDFGQNVLSRPQPFYDREDSNSNIYNRR